MEDQAVDDAVFMGIYAAKQARSGVLPVQNESGIWQAWSMPDGNYMIQPLSGERQPVGALSLMDAREFIHVFDPMPAEVSYDDFEDDGTALRADAPNLLARWYMQAIEESPISLEDDDDLPAPVFGNNGNLLDEEPLFASPEALFFDNPAGDEGLAATAQVLSPRQPSLGGALLSPAEEYIRYLTTLPINDVSLRQEFVDLLKELRGGIPDPVTEEKTRLFLDIDLGDLPKKAHLYTEFGLALRREHQMGLALIAHQKALDCSSDDANILFNIARTWYELGNYEEARSFLNKALSVAPGFETAKNFLHFLSTDASGK